MTFESGSLLYSKFPRIGSFEVYFRGTILFSKLKSRAWPDSKSIVKAIKTMLKTKKYVKKYSALPKTSARSQKLKKRSTVLIRPKIQTFKDFPKVLKKQLSIESQSILVATGKQSNTCGVQKQTAISVRPQSAVTKNSYTLASSSSNERIVEQESSRVHPLREITQKFELEINVHQELNKKITYSNREGKDGEFCLVSSNSEFMSVNPASVTIQSGKKSRFSLKFTPVNRACSKVFYLYIDFEGKPKDCYEITVTYT